MSVHYILTNIFLNGLKKKKKKPNKNQTGLSALQF